jgi:Chaperone of endosialidase
MSGAVRETTKYFDFEIPQFDFPGWHVYYDRNIKTVDTILYLMTGTDSLKGIWKNNELYNIGDRVVDVDVAFAYECFVQHTSPYAPTTFAEARIANPNYWHAIDFIQALAGTSSTSVVIGTGNKAFTTQSGRIFSPGAKIIINSAADPTVDYMWGAVVSYDGQQLVVDVEVTGGSGTHSDWLLSVSGERGPIGPIGPTGIQGPQGDVGPEGPKGDVGPQGIIEEPNPDSATYGRTYDGTTGSWIVVAATNAATLPIVPAGGISSTTMQNAIYELDTEKVNKAGDTMTGALTQTKPGHWTHTAPGAGSYYNTSTTTDRFFLGTDDASDIFRISSTGTGGNAFSVDGASGKISVIHPPSSDNHIATKKYVDGLTASVVDTAGDTMTGALVLPTLYVNHPNNSDIWYQIGGSNRWLVRCEPGGDLNWHHYNDAGTYLGSILTLQRLTNDAIFQHDVVALNSLKSSGGIAIGSNVSTGLMSDGSSLLLRAVGNNPTYLQGVNGGVNYAYFANGGSRVFGSLYCDNTITTPGSMDASGPVTSGYSDGIRCTTPSYWHARFYTTVAGVRSWAVGCVNWGSFGIWDESAGRQCMIIDTNGNTGFAANVSAPTFSGTFNGNVNGNCSGTAGGISTGGSITVGAIEGPYYIDMMHPGHGGDYNARLIVHADHALQISSSYVIVDNDINISGRVIPSGGYKSRISANSWDFGWSGTLEAYIDGNSWGSVLNAHSDYRLKKDVTNLDNMWDKVKAIRPVKYTAADWEPYSTSDETERWGFLAHELQEALIPTAATGEKDGEDAPQQPHWPVILAAVTKALQEAMTRIETLEAALATRK